MYLMQGRAFMHNPTCLPPDTSFRDTARTLVARGRSSSSELSAIATACRAPNVLTLIIICEAVPVRLKP
jgi:hypothetical protein